MLLAEHEGEVLAGQMAIAHGRTVTNVAAGRSAVHPDLRPNELLHLAAMAWGQDQGRTTYDLNGVDLPADGTGRTPDAGGAGGPGVTHFKLGLGGEVVRFPGAHDRLFVPGGRMLTRSIAPRLGALRPWAQRLLGRHRT
jgi:lipid II:glycine glycyltransferase (peptidoglycan interpeptide bridge formation enzyme)